MASKVQRCQEVNCYRFIYWTVNCHGFIHWIVNCYRFLHWTVNCYRFIHWMVNCHGSIHWIVNCYRFLQWTVNCYRFIHSIVNCLRYKETKGPITIVYSIKWKYEGPFQETLKESKLAQLDNVLYKWFTEMCSEGTPMTGCMIIQKQMSSWWNTNAWQVHSPRELVTKF